MSSTTEFPFQIQDAPVIAPPGPPAPVVDPPAVVPDAPPLVTLPTPDLFNSRNRAKPLTTAELLASRQEQAAGQVRDAEAQVADVQAALDAANARAAKLERLAKLLAENPEIAGLLDELK